MVKLLKLRRDAQKINDGEWVRPGEEFEDLELKIRGYTFEFTDARAERFRAAARKYGGDIAKVKGKESHAIVVSTIKDYLLLDVRGVVDQDGTPIDVDKFKELLSDMNFQMLVRACIEAAGQVGQERLDEDGNALKN
jgi:hypothetical protein